MSRAESQWCQMLTKEREQCLSHACGQFYVLKEFGRGSVGLSRQLCRTHYLMLKRQGSHLRRIK